MERKNKECDIIADLLPMYLEHVTKPETNCFIEEHLAECESCRKNYEWMKDSFAEAFTLEDKNKVNRKKARMFKKVKWKMLLYAYVFLLILIWFYCIGDFLFVF